MMSPNCIIIGLAGKAGSGKDTAANFIPEHRSLWYLGWESHSFAAPIKECIQAIFDISVSNQNDRSLKEVIDPVIGKSPRELAQFIGTEIGRNVLSPWLGLTTHSIWIKSLEYRTDSNTELVIIPDVRFQDEADWILDRGPYNQIIYLERPGATGSVGISNHPSEAGFIPKDRSRYHELLNDSNDPNVLRDTLYTILDRCTFS